MYPISGNVSNVDIPTIDNTPASGHIQESPTESNMSSHSSVAKSVREKKERNPELFCSVKGCLWRIKTSRGDSPCRKHPFENLVASFGPERFDLSVIRSEDR